MASKVYFTNARTRSGRNLLDKTATLFERAGFGKFIQKDDLVAIKLHVGEPGNLAFLQPPLVRRVVEKTKEKGGRPFLTDSNTLYRGYRSNAVDHMESALKNGFSYETVGAPFIVADGLRGQEYEVVPIDGIRLKEARIGAALARAEAMVALTHFKGHGATGFGGALKNVGMGGACRAGKQIQHSSLKPRIDQSRCTGCKRCIKVCPEEAISLDEAKKAFIDYSLCIGCAECTITCLEGAIAVNWDQGEEGSLQERMAEYTLGVVVTKPGKCGFINFLLNISPDCDCAGWSDVPIVPNLGILASTDPIAIDQASIDLVNSAPGLPDSRLGDQLRASDKFAVVHKIDWSYQLKHGEKIGLGSREYELIEVK